MGRRGSFVRALQFGLLGVVASALLGGAVVLGARHRVQAALDQSHSALQLLDDCKEVQIQLAAARAAEREFVLEDLRAPNFFQTGESPALAAHAVALEELDRLLVRLAARSDASALQVPELRASVATYSRSFEELVALYRERGSLYSGVLGTMREASYAVQASAEALETRSLLVELFLLERDHADYLRDLDNRPRFLVTERIQVVAEEIAALPTQQAKPLREALARYREAWERLLEIDDRIGRSSGSGLRGTLRSSQETVLPLALLAAERAHHRFVAARGAVERAEAVALASSLGTALVALGIGLGLTLWLGRRLNGSLKRVVGAVNAYAGGQRDARVGVLPHADEFDVLGRAFDAMAETLAEASEELEEINASLELAVKGDTAGLLERIKSLVAERRACASR